CFSASSKCLSSTQKVCMSTIRVTTFVWQVTQLPRKAMSNLPAWKARGHLPVGSSVSRSMRKSWVKLSLNKR
ncbi:modulator of DNA gyrase family protein, partial [Vibrio parahaemolyticus V-223/04]